MDALRSAEKTVYSQRAEQSSCGIQLSSNEVAELSHLVIDEEWSESPVLQRLD